MLTERTSGARPTWASRSSRPLASSRRFARVHAAIAWPVAAGSAPLCTVSIRRSSSIARYDHSDCRVASRSQPRKVRRVSRAGARRAAHAASRAGAAGLWGAIVGARHNGRCVSVSSWLQLASSSPEFGLMNFMDPWIMTRQCVGATKTGSVYFVADTSGVWQKYTVVIGARHWRQLTSPAAPVKSPTSESLQLHAHDQRPACLPIGASASLLVALWPLAA